MPRKKKGIFNKWTGGSVKGGKKPRVKDKSQKAWSGDNLKDKKKNRGFWGRWF